MPEITKCLNEWNATIEALGHGKPVLSDAEFDKLKESILHTK